MMDEQKFKKRILLRLSKGVTTIDELKFLCQFFKKKYKRNGKDFSSYIEFQCYNELLRRLSSSVFTDVGREYPIGFRKYCIYGEYHNTKMFIETTTRLIKKGITIGDITYPNFYGLPNSKFSISLETLIHIFLRHNETVNGFINPDSKTYGHNPSSFTMTGFTLPISMLFLTLSIIEDKDWKSPEKGKNLLCHVRIDGQEYTIVRKGHSKEIKSFYPRNDDRDLNFIELERIPDKLEYERK